jgi:hypothetical protein
MDENNGNSYGGFVEKSFIFLFNTILKLLSHKFANIICIHKNNVMQVVQILTYCDSFVRIKKKVFQCGLLQGKVQFHEFWIQN